MSHPGGAPAWLWDGRARRYYIYDARRGYHVWENGDRRSDEAPRVIPLSTDSTRQTVPLSTSPTTRNDRQNYSLSNRLNSTDARDIAYGASGPSQNTATGNTGQGGLRSPDPLRHDFAKITLADDARPPLRNEEKRWIGEDGGRFFSVLNPVSEVHTVLQTGPAEQITDPALLQQGIKATQKLYGTRGDTEALFEGFRRRDQPRKFFTWGKVFRVLWSEPAGSGTNVTFEEPGVTAGRFGEPVHSKVRLFVVIREGDNYCSALPILTYSGRGVAKPNVNKSEHGIIYSGRTAPSASPSEAPAGRNETGMRSDAVRVNLDDKADPLHEMSRLDYGKVYTIQHNIKVKSYGVVHPSSSAALHTQFLNVWLRNVTLPAGPTRPADSTSGMPTAGNSSRQRVSQRRDSHSTRASDPRAAPGPSTNSSGAAGVLQAQAKAALTRLTQEGHSLEEARKIVAAHHQQATRGAQTTSTHEARENSDDDDRSSEGSGESEFSGNDERSRRSERGGERPPATGQSQTTHTQQRVQPSYPPRVDSIVREQPAPRLTSTQRPPTQGSSNQLPSRYTFSTQPPVGQTLPAQASSSYPPSAQSPLTQRPSTQAPPPQHLPAQTQSSSQTLDIIRQLMERGYTREQALRYVSTAMAKRSNS